MVRILHEPHYDVWKIPHEHPPENAKWPFVLESDRDCLRMALSIIPERPTGPVIVYGRDTLALSDAYVSETAITLLRDRKDVAASGQAAPVRWNRDALVSPFDSRT